MNRPRWLADPHYDSYQQHDDRTRRAHADILQTFQSRTDAVIPQSAHFLMRVQPRFGLVDGRHVSASSCWRVVRVQFEHQIAAMLEGCREKEYSKS